MRRVSELLPECMAVLLVGTFVCVYVFGYMQINKMTREGDVSSCQRLAVTAGTQSKSGVSQRVPVKLPRDFDLLDLVFQPSTRTSRYTLQVLPSGCNKAALLQASAFSIDDQGTIHALFDLDLSRFKPGAYCLVLSADGGTTSEVYQLSIVRKLPPWV